MKKTGNLFVLLTAAMVSACSVDDSNTGNVGTGGATTSTGIVGAQAVLAAQEAEATEGRAGVCLEACPG